MPPDSPEKRPALPRSRVVEVITRAQEDAFRQLIEAGVPETEALLVIRRFSAFALQVLRDLDRIYQEFEELLASDPDRSKANQEYLDTRAGGWLLALESFIAALVAEAMEKAKKDYQTLLSQPQEVITTVPPAPRSPPWQEALRKLGQSLTPWLLLLVAFFAWFLVWWQVSGLVTIGVIAIGITVFMGLFFGEVGLWLSAVMGGLCLILLLLL
jgi:hypothetical protein